MKPWSSVDLQGRAHMSNIQGVPNLIEDKFAYTSSVLCQFIMQT